MAIINHPPHEVEASGLLAHLVDRHGYTADTIEGASSAFLIVTHDRAHRRMAEDVDGTPAALAGQAQRLYALMRSVLADVAAQDPELARDMREQWAAQLLRDDLEGYTGVPIY